MRMIRLKIDGKIVLAPEGTTILNAALKAGIQMCIRDRSNPFRMLPSLSWGLMRDCLR